MSVRLAVAFALDAGGPERSAGRDARPVEVAQEATAADGGKKPAAWPAGFLRRGYLLPWRVGDGRIGGGHRGGGI